MHHLLLGAAAPVVTTKEISLSTHCPFTDGLLRVCGSGGGFRNRGQGCVSARWSHTKSSLMWITATQAFFFNGRFFLFFFSPNFRVSSPLYSLWSRQAIASMRGLQPSGPIQYRASYAVCSNGWPRHAHRRRAFWTTIPVSTAFDSLPH